jgi:tRNA (guanine10-N2)-dimethyltransferase
MELLFELSGDVENLPISEILAQVDSKSCNLFGRCLIVETDDMDEKDIELLSLRLAFTHSIHRLLFKTNVKNLKKDFQKFDWKSIYKKDFCIRVHNMENPEGLEKEYAAIVWEAVDNPKVKLKKSKTEINVLNIDGDVFVTKFLFDTDKTYVKRKPHLRPELHPSSINPKLARACINLTGLKYGTIVDPFCGTGGIMIEAGLMGFDTIGYDLDQIMLIKAKINIEHYRVSKFKLEIKDATKLSKKLDKNTAVVTDLPYGRASKLHSKELHKLYSDFIGILFNVIEKGNKCVVILPDSVDSSFIKNFKIKEKFHFYLHKSLSKQILVLEKS